MISPDDAAALLKAVLPLAREHGVDSLEMGEFRVKLGPAPVSGRRVALTDEEADEEAAAAEEERRIGHADLMYAHARSAR